MHRTPTTRVASKPVLWLTLILCIAVGLYSAYFAIDLVVSGDLFPY